MIIKLFRFFNKSLSTKKNSQKPTSMMVSFLGPDGSGKSTIIDAVTSADIPFVTNDYFHLKPLKKKISSDVSEMVTDPHKYPPYSAIKSYSKLLLFVYQYNMGWIKNILPLENKSSLIIFDRYYDDLLVDSRRYRYGGSLEIAKLVRFFIPQPEIYFVLVADPKVIYKRKQEVAFEELERQVVAYESLVDGKQYFRIDVDNTVDDISSEVIKIIGDFYARR